MLATAAVTRVNIKIDYFSLHKTCVKTPSRRALTPRLAVLGPPSLLPCSSALGWASGSGEARPKAGRPAPWQASGVGMGPPWHSRASPVLVTGRLFSCKFGLGAGRGARVVRWAAFDAGSGCCSSKNGVSERAVPLLRAGWVHLMAGALSPIAHGPFSPVPSR